MEITLKKKYFKLTSDLIASNVYYVTCFECCKYYSVPTTASCGHSLCHTCWYGRQTCPNCSVKINRKSLKLNLVLQNLTEHIHKLQDAANEFFGIENDLQTCMSIDEDPTKNVNEWLNNSQNQFSAPITTPESIPEMIIPAEMLGKDIQLRQDRKIQTKCVLIDQTDWDKIEELPDSEEILDKGKENTFGSNDIVPYEIMDEDQQYSTDNPRRSSRKKDIALCNKKIDSLSKTNKSKNKLNVVQNMKEKLKKGKLNISLEVAKNESSSTNKVPHANTILDTSTKYDKNVLVHVPCENDIVKNNTGKYSYTKKTIDSCMHPKSPDIGKAKENVSNYQENPSKNKVCFFKRSPLIDQTGFNIDNNETSEIVNTDDIEITIKVGKCVTNIFIQKKDNDIKVKLDPGHDIKQSIPEKNNVNKISVATSPYKDNREEKRKTTHVNKSIQVTPEEITSEIISKKNTASADTSILKATKSMEGIKEIKKTNKSFVQMAKSNSKDCPNDFDMFDSESIKEGYIQPLSRSVHTPSAIIRPSNISKFKSQATKTTPKRNKRERDEIETEKSNKKGKIIPSTDENRLVTLNESEPGDYNEILHEVFANINKDLKKDKDTDSANYISNTQKMPSQKSSQSQMHINMPVTQKCSENVFSLLEHEVDIGKSQGKHNNYVKEKKRTQHKNDDMECGVAEISSTPENDDSDKSVVEETPQKDISKSKQDRTNNSKRESKSMINPTEKITDRVVSIETPKCIYKFENNLQHRSTPFAKKSLDFNNHQSVNTQEKEIMCKEFEPMVPVRKYCLVASCLTQAEVAKVKLLCAQRKWTFVNNFTPDVTHLIVSVCEENRAQRSVKFMCALAASKWIVSMEWIHKCFDGKEIPNEEPHEVLDTTGEPGPRRSRLARHKLFAGIKFYCLSPFQVLAIDTLKEILVYSGGAVVNNIGEMKATEEPSLLLGDPEHTQENRFINLVLELKVVPVNYEWVLNSLGCYTLASINSLLLCPSSLLPAVVSEWPFALICSEDSIED